MTPAVAALGLTPVTIAPGAVTNRYKYIARLPTGVDRSVLKKRLREEWDVSLSGEVYEVPLHRQPVFERWSGQPLPGADEACARHVCLPVSAVMTTDQADYVVGALQAVLQ